MRYFGGSRRGDVLAVEPLNERKAVRYPAPGEEQSGEQSLVDGFARLSQADPRGGSRRPIGGRPLYPPYREDT